ncbi:MAG: hypothetical protein R2867_02325 [Caldilineaceae bacterium]
MAAPIVHDNNCPGQYVMGRVINGAGEPVAGVWIKMNDQWGNEATTVSKSGAIDYGLFDFPIPSGALTNYTSPCWVRVASQSAPPILFRITRAMKAVICPVTILCCRAANAAFTI